MKKILCILLSTIFILSLTSCGTEIKDLKSTIDPKTTTTQTTTEPTTVETTPEMTTISREELDGLVTVDISETIETNIMEFFYCGGFIEKSQYEDVYIYKPTAIIKNTSDAPNKILAVSVLATGYQAGYELPNSEMDRDLLSNYKNYTIPMKPNEERLIDISPVVVANLDVPLEIVFSLPTASGWGKCIYKLENPRDWLKSETTQ